LRVLERLVRNLLEWLQFRGTDLDGRLGGQQARQGPHGRGA